MKVLITGAKGFIGNHLAERLKRLGDEVESFDVADKQDIRVPFRVQAAVDGKDAVFHLAAVADLNWAMQHPVETFDINVGGTWNVAYACTKAGAKLYYASTCCVYGNQEHHPTTEQSLPNPAEIYGCTKLAGENIIKGLHYSYDLKYNLMRFATIYGPGARDALATHIFLGQAIRGEPVTVHGDGTQTRTLTYVDDLVDAIVALYMSGKMNDVWNMTATEEISALRMAIDIKWATESRSPVSYIPQRTGQVFREEISADKMLRETGWNAKTSWAEGIEKMRQWFVETKQNRPINERIKSGYLLRDDKGTMNNVGTIPNDVV